MNSLINSFLLYFRHINIFHSTEKVYNFKIFIVNIIKHLHMDWMLRYQGDIENPTCGLRGVIP